MPRTVTIPDPGAAHNSPQNLTRMEGAAAAIQAWADERNMPNENESAVRDLLTDLMHYCAQYPSLDFGAEIEVACGTFEEESEDGH